MGALLIYERRAGTGWLTLNRPAEMNSLTPELLHAIASRLAEAKTDQALRVLIVTGAGRAFCAGADLKFLDTIPAGDRDRATAAFLSLASATFTTLAEFPKPTIAAANGIATAGGLELVLACDLVIAAREAKIGDGHANYGLLPGAGSAVRLPRRIGAARAKFLFFTGDLVGAETLVAAGLVNEVVDRADLEERVNALAATLATRSPLGLARMKVMANLAIDMPEAAGLALEQALGALHTTSHDYNEGLAAFKARRLPSFEGR
jgi:enoyl-CoA hydratase/carnithine racemase